MSRDPLLSLPRQIKNIIKQEAAPRVRQAFLMFPYDGASRQVMIQLSDPGIGQAMCTRATVQPGVVAGSIIPAFTAVSVICRHGHYEVIGLRG